MDRCAKVKKGHLHSSLNLSNVAGALNHSMSLAQATNRRREVGFLSQAVIETDYFRTFAEYGRGASHDYGNYFGRGMHQLTWEATYKACSTALYNDDRLVLKIPTSFSTTLRSTPRRQPGTGVTTSRSTPSPTKRTSTRSSTAYTAALSPARRKPSVTRSTCVNRFTKTIKMILNARSDGKL